MILIWNAVILTMAGSVHKPGYLLAEPPLIHDVGAGRPPQDWLEDPRLTVIDAGGDWLLPGMIDAHCHVGLCNDGLAAEYEDDNEWTDPVTPHLQAIDGIFQDDRCFAEALAHGVTGVMSGPGSTNVLAGRFTLLRTTGRTAETMAIRSAAAMKAALGENPKRAFGRKEKTPATRMATAALLRDALAKAGHYRQEKERRARLPAPEPQAAIPEPDARWEALLPVLSGAQLLKIHAHRTDDILTAIRIANEFGLRYTLDHCTEGYLIADLLAGEYQAGREAGRGCGQPGRGRLEGIVAGPLLADRSKPELNRASIDNPSILAAAGLPVAIMTDHPVIPIQYLAVSAAVAARAGLPEDLALAAVTITAARLCDAADSLGSLEPGKQADLVLFSGHPLDFRSHVRLVFSQGKLVYRGAGEKVTC